MATKSKSLRTIDNNAAYSIVNAAYKQAVGDAAVSTLDLSDFCDSGVAFESLTMSRDKFMKALMDQVVNFYNDTAYDDEFVDPYYVEDRRFANICQMINVQAPSVTSSHAWGDFAPTVDGGGNKTYKTIGTYTIYPPECKTSYFSKTVSYELPVAITSEQLEDAFKSAEELRGFIDYVFVVVDNKLREHRRSLSENNRNSFMGHKINAHNTGVAGIHKIDLLAKYNTERGGSLTSVADFLSDADALRFAGAQIKLYSEYMRKQSSLFNTEGLVKFCPTDRMVLEVNSAFESAIEECALSTTYHDTVVALPGHYSTPAWQGFGVTDGDAGTAATGFDQVSKISVTLDKEDAHSQNITVTQSGIVAFMADKYAVMHTIRNERTAVQHFDLENIDLYAFQARSAYINNLAQNAIVFTIEPVVTPPVSGIRMNM